MNRFNWRLATPIALAIICAVILMWYGSRREAVKPQTQQESEADHLAKERAEAERKAQEEARAFDNAYFDFDRYNIGGDQVPPLVRNADRMKARPDFRMTIKGHCDERGTIEYNLALGQRRADGVRRFLAKQGIDPSRLTTVSYGKERPADPGHDEAAWAKNRRTVFVVSEPPLSIQ